MLFVIDAHSILLRGSRRSSRYGHKKSRSGLLSSRSSYTSGGVLRLQGCNYCILSQLIEESISARWLHLAKKGKWWRIWGSSFPSRGASDTSGRWYNLVSMHPGSSQQHVIRTKWPPITWNLFTIIISLIFNSRLMWPIVKEDIKDRWTTSGSYRRTPIRSQKDG